MGAHVKKCVNGHFQPEGPDYQTASGSSYRRSWTSVAGVTPETGTQAPKQKLPDRDAQVPRGESYLLPADQGPHDDVVAGIGRPPVPIPLVP